jgi:hypothetical protein
VLIDELKNLLQIEIDLLNGFAGLEVKLQEAFLRRDWPALDTLVSELDSFSGGIEAIEQRRHSTFLELKVSLKLDEKTTFNRVITEMSGEDREELSDFYRKLKIAVIRVRGATGRLGYYFRSVSDSVNRVLSELLPYRKGRIYSRGGLPRAVEEASLVFNREL